MADGQSHVPTIIPLPGPSLGLLQTSKVMPLPQGSPHSVTNRLGVQTPSPMAPARNDSEEPRLFQSAPPSMGVQLHHIQGPLCPLPLPLHPGHVDLEDTPSQPSQSPLHRDPQTGIPYGLLTLFSTHAEQIHCPQRHGQGCSLQHFVCNSRNHKST